MSSGVVRQPRRRMNIAREGPTSHYRLRRVASGSVGRRVESLRFCLETGMSALRIATDEMQLRLRGIRRSLPKSRRSDALTAASGQWTPTPGSGRPRAAADTARANLRSAQNAVASQFQQVGRRSQPVRDTVPAVDRDGGQRVAAYIEVRAHRRGLHPQLGSIRVGTRASEAADRKSAPAFWRLGWFRHR